MATLAERLAAKRAALLVEDNKAEATMIASVEAAVAKTPVLASSDPEAHQQAQTDHAAEQEEEVPVSKPMTFAEKLAAKKAQQKAEAPALEKPAAPIPASVSPIAAMETPSEAEEPKVPMTFAEKLAAKKGAIASIGQSAPAAAQAKAVREFSIDPSRLPEDAETAQQLTDISKRIFELEELMDDDLARSMSDLKDALLKNPAASELILDEDVGKMVSALRRMRHLSVVSTAATKKAKATTKPKAKEVALTPEQLAQAWDEL